jgi:hypothetical protein
MYTNSMERGRATGRVHAEARATELTARRREWVGGEVLGARVVWGEIGVQCVAEGGSVVQPGAWRLRPKPTPMGGVTNGGCGWGGAA